MSASNAFETALLGLILENTNVANVGDATGLRGSTAPGSLYISLHTADPGEAGAQNTSEATYTGYARAAVARDIASWNISGNVATNAAIVAFPAATAGTSNVTHFGIGASLSGAGTLLLSGPLTASLAIAAGITPDFAIGALSVTAD